MNKSMVTCKDYKLADADLAGCVAAGDQDAGDVARSIVRVLTVRATLHLSHYSRLFEFNY